MAGALPNRRDPGNVKGVNEAATRSHGHKPRVLILSASAGSGHVRAADALHKVCARHWRVGEVVNLDALTYTNKLFRDFYSKLYLALVREAPTFLGWWYETSDEPWKTDKMRFMLDRLNTGPLVKLIKRLRPDITICTHFLPAEIISHLIEKRVIQTRLSIVVTDFDFHAMWLSRVFHHYFVALEETRVHLKMMGMPAERVTVSGIPIDPAFAERFEPRAARRALGLAEDRPVILVSAGTFGVGPAQHVARVLAELNTPAQIVVVCGKSEELKRRVEAQAASTPRPHLEFRVQGYTDRMQDWMAAADLFVGKPGGLTTAEALARGLPFVVFSPIPGQEERNSDHLLEKGVAIKCNEVTTMPYKIDCLLHDPVRLRHMRAAARRMARPHAASTIVRTLLYLQETHPVTVAEKTQEAMVEAVRKK